MRRWLALFGALAIACGDPSPAPTPREAPRPVPARAPEPPRAPPPPAPTPAEPPAAAPAPPSREELEEARARCNEGDTALRAGDLETAQTRIVQEALPVLERAVDPADRGVLGACFYNAARLAEERLDVPTARERYDASLAARPNPIAERRRRALGEREVWPEDDDYERVERQLAQAEGHPCGARACALEIVLLVHAGGGPLRRAAVVAVREDEDQEVLPLHLAFAGPVGPFRWGPRLWAPDAGSAVEYDEPTPFAAFRPAIPDRPWLLFARVHVSWEERCCGGVAGGDDADLAICEIGEDAARCVRVAERRRCEGEANDVADNGYDPCDHDHRRFATFDERGLEVHGTAGAEGGALTVGVHPWATLFPPGE